MNFTPAEISAHEADSHMPERLRLCGPAIGGIKPFAIFTSGRSCLFAAPHD